jgi:ATP-dependent DNA helicase RecG
VVRPIAELCEAQDATLRARVASVRVSGWRGRRARGEAIVEDETGRARLVWFGRAAMGVHLRPGDEVVCTGRVARYQGLPQLAHPDVVPAERAGAEAVRVRYPDVAGVAPRLLERLCRAAALGCADRVRDGIPAALAGRLGLPDLAEALRALHVVAADALPDVVADLQAGRSPAHRRLVFDELFFLQLGLERRRRLLAREPGEPCDPDGDALPRLLGRLPFPLTAAQRRVVEEIRGDMAGDRPMGRLLQGDVGSGKTVVALCAAELAMASGRQAAIMAPTEILAAQHLRTIEPLARAAGRRVALLTADTPRPARESILALLHAGALDLLIGTHALLAERVAFARLGLVVVDEQHRFGVAQRARLRLKGERVPHLLVMTATPIPRTLALTLYGDLELSVLDELPPGREPCATRVVDDAERSVAWTEVRSRLRDGDQAFVVCPLVEESAGLDVADAVSTARRLERELPDVRVGLVHGRMAPHQRETVLRRFRQGEIALLVATTLIEVGLDVPEAAVMVVEHAERFGLAQLHQLRGRVGRGRRRGLCLLMASGESPRLAALAETTDGFRIAEADLELRGPGEMFGTRQAGVPRCSLAHLRQHGPLLEEARRAARALLDEDPGLARFPDTAAVLRARWDGADQYGEEAG